jgi:hypothetical protein
MDLHQCISGPFRIWSTWGHLWNFTAFWKFASFGLIFFIPKKPLKYFKVPHFVSTELAKLPRIDHHQPARAQIPGQLFERRRPPHTGALEMAAYENLPAEEFEDITDALDFWRKNEHVIDLKYFIHI